MSCTQTTGLYSWLCRLPNVTIIGVTSQTPTNTTSTSQSPANTTSTQHHDGSSTDVGAIVGGVFGGVGGIVLVVLLVWFLRWRSSRTKSKGDGINLNSHPAMTQAMPYDYLRMEAIHSNRQLSGHNQGLDSAVGYTSRTKAREALGLPDHNLYPSPDIGAHDPSSATSSSDLPGANPGNGSTNPVSPSEVLGLRQEIVNLLQMMQFGQTDGQSSEAPPSYES